MNNANAKGVRLSTASRRRLRAFAAHVGERAAIEALGCADLVFYRAVAGYGIRRASAIVIEQVLDAAEKKSSAA